ncbi:HD domain-containing protein [Corallincola luteus]|uniref:HD domain-containing protein n=1 Tax=Corallincola luteus TaxID=1775177 RepID=A0ABY2APK1_9GAMM|nr:HD domain-containing protein [Corallincola luteus]TCI05130.1 HD domain-containing protein [Corallincola luteus]
MKQPEIETEIPLIEEILGSWQTALMADYQGYKNHVYRMLHFCFALHECRGDDREKLIIAACFHDLGIWPEGSVDYLPPSMALAKNYLEKRGRVDWEQEILLMIDMHHKLRPYTDPRFPLVEIFRQADLVDVSFGKIGKGIPKPFIEQVKAVFPNAGFHQRLRQLAWQHFKKNPFNPIPMMKW